VALSTFYTQHHFAIDSLAGIIFALWLNLLVAPTLFRWFACDSLARETSESALS
jgi:hypothetical protein